MTFRPHSFNLYLLAALLLLGNGCGSSSGGDSGKKDIATLRFYLESRRNDPSGAMNVKVAHGSIPLLIERDPFLTEEDVSRAVLVNNDDGTYAIQVFFTDHGALVLEMTTTQNKGKDVAVLSHFPPKGFKPPKDSEGGTLMTNAPGQPRMSGWIGAVLIRQPMTSSIVFTPDATREETDRIVRGVNNMVTRRKKRDLE